eukprot:2406410-Lingulodinium_polyedra.AAC.1
MSMSPPRGRDEVLVLQGQHSVGAQVEVESEEGGEGGLPGHGVLQLQKGGCRHDHCHPRDGLTREPP